VVEPTVEPLDSMADVVMADPEAVVVTVPVALVTVAVSVVVTPPVAAMKKFSKFYQLQTRRIGLTAVGSTEGDSRANGRSIGTTDSGGAVTDTIHEIGVLAQASGISGRASKGWSLLEHVVDTGLLEKCQHWNGDLLVRDLDMPPN
jgi:hypothetical protein